MFAHIYVDNFSIICSTTFYSALSTHVRGSNTIPLGAWTPWAPETAYREPRSESAHPQAFRVGSVGPCLHALVAGLKTYVAAGQEMPYGCVYT